MRIEPNKIMCAIDFSEFSRQVLVYGRSLAKRFEAKLVLCHVVSNMVLVSSAGQAYIASSRIERERREDALAGLNAMADELGFETEVLVVAGHPADTLSETAAEMDVDLVIAATHGGSGIRRFLVGSVTDRLVKTLACPLMVLHSQENQFFSLEDEDIGLNRILVGCDFSPDSKLAFDYGLSLAQEFQSELILAHVIRPSERVQFTSADYIKVQEGDYLGWTPADYLGLQKGTRDKSDEIRTGFIRRIEGQLNQMVPEESRNWCTPVTAILEGEPFSELIRFSDQSRVDLIVLGIHGHGLLERFLVGSTTDRVISRGRCPVLAVRDES